MFSGRRFIHDALGHPQLVDPLNYFVFQPVLCKGYGRYYPVYEIMDIKSESVSHDVVGAGFLSNYSLTI